MILDCVCILLLMIVFDMFDLILLLMLSGVNNGVLVLSWILMRLCFMLMRNLFLFWLGKVNLGFFGRGVDWFLLVFKLNWFSDLEDELMLCWMLIYENWWFVSWIGFFGRNFNVFGLGWKMIFVFIIFGICRILIFKNNYLLMKLMER